MFSSLKCIIDTITYTHLVIHTYWHTYCHTYLYLYTLTHKWSDQHCLASRAPVQVITKTIWAELYARTAAKSSANWCFVIGIILVFYWIAVHLRLIFFCTLSMIVRAWAVVEFGASKTVLPSFRHQAEEDWRISRGRTWLITTFCVLHCPISCYLSCVPSWVVP